MQAVHPMNKKLVLPKQNQRTNKSFGSYFCSFVEHYYPCVPFSMPLASRRYNIFPQMLQYYRSLVTGERATQLNKAN